MRQRLEDMFFVGLALMFMALGFWTMWHTKTEREVLKMENQKLKHYLATLCRHIDGLPEHRAVFDVCLENIRR